MSVNPAAASEAVDLLMRRCPELLPAWRHLCDEMEADSGADVGIYNAFGVIVHPLLLYALDGHAVPRDLVGPLWHTSGAAHRDSTFRAQSQWAAIPDRGTAGLDDLVARLYECLDLWAVSPDIDLRHAVYIEMVEAGYVDLTLEDLLGPAGPNLRALAERRHQ